MAWQAESEWRTSELLDPTCSLSSSTGGTERAQHGAANFQSFGPDAGQVGLTYSASCPSLSELDDVHVLLSGTAATTTTGAQCLVPYPFGAHEPLVDATAGESPLFLADKSFDLLLQLQQAYQDVPQRQFPHQQVTTGHPMDLIPQPPPLTGERRALHSSQSCTSLSSMESEYHRTPAPSKRKKASERWMKLQRHKSFDSTVPISEAMDFDASACAENTSMTSALLTPDQLLQEPLDDDMVGYCIDGTSSAMHSADPNDWSPLAPASATSYAGDGYMQHATHKQQPHADMPIPSDAGDDFTSPAHTEPVSELDMLLSEHERSNLFDAIRDFHLPCGAETVDTQLIPQEAQCIAQTQRSTPIGAKATSDALSTGTTETASSRSLPPEEQTNCPDEASRPLSLDSASSPSAARLPPSGCIPMRTRLHQILVLSVQNTDAASSLSSYERNYLMQSSLFSPAKAPETAGSLWLLLHAAQCEVECEIADCCVMRRVLNHCLGCELTVGKCKQPCNDAKAMLLHYGSCNSKGSMHGRSCSVCWNLLEIDYSHQALSNGNGGDHSTGRYPSFVPSPFASSPTSLQLGSPPSAPPVPPGSPTLEHPPAYCSPPGRSTVKRVGPSKHVHIQPNPLPTASNPLGLIGLMPPQFGHSLSLYLEQTSALFRAEVKTRIEKRVTAAAGQDLLEHMQKKTRLRSLDDLRLEARSIVLGEMEHKLLLYMQAYNWANAPAGEESVLKSAPQLPPYLMNFSVAAFEAQQQQQQQQTACQAEQVRAQALPPVGP
ncbi:unnamed protein product [Hyaloperonospora brassicae]|uniref:TAZ-type domain-containing protein n=1 Tax=Hyaloperonospora brassicae TaxID=162125 RepID=A0AAV0UTE9_HYABA|nr:unnamed protein product [Hyaloperonospora brassicae]